MPLSAPLNFKKWLKDKEGLLQPPVNNYCLYRGDDFVVMAIGGPNERLDYHVDETEVRNEGYYLYFQSDLKLYRNGFTSTKVTWFFEPLMKKRFVTSGSKKERCFCFPVCFTWSCLGRLVEIILANIPHNPVRFANSIGLVIERIRPEGSLG